MATSKGIYPATEKTVGDKIIVTKGTKKSPGRGPREDGSGSNTPVKR